MCYMEENIEEIFNEILECDLNEAFKYCNDGFKKTGNPEYLIYTAHSYLLQGNFEDAIAAIDLAFELGCDYYVYGYNVKGEALLELGLYVESRRTLEKVIKIEPEQYHTNLLLLELDIREGLYEDAINRCKEYINTYGYESSQIGELNSAIAWTYLIDLNNPEEAKKYFKDAIKCNPTYSRAYTGLGIYESYKRNYNKAIEYFTYALELDPNDGENYFGLAVCNKELKNYDVIETYLMQANELDPENNMILEEFAFELIRQERNEEAIQYLEECLDYNIDNNDISNLINELKNIN